MQDFTTPMMKQYMAIKKAHEDCLVFYRMGDFYELFLDDAILGAEVLNITLTSRPKGKDGKIPMAGVPYHAVDSYLAKLVKAGHKVAICEQVSLPNKYGIVDRQVVRIVTPGTVLDEHALSKKENNYLMSMIVEHDMLAISVADVSTGYFSTSEMLVENAEQTIQDELARYAPSECILPNELYNDPFFLKVLQTQKGVNIYPFPSWNQFSDRAEKVLKEHFGVATLAGFNLADKPLAQKSAAALLGYLMHTQKSPVVHIKKMVVLGEDACMQLDRSTMLNLELFSTIREHDTRGSLLSVLDYTHTAMGGRLLKLWLRKPLKEKDEIVKRHDAVGELLKNTELRIRLEEHLKEITDMERILSRLSLFIGNARDLSNLTLSLIQLLQVKKSCEDLQSPLLQTLRKEIKPCLQTVIDVIEKNIVPEPPLDVKEGGIIKPGVNAELDTLRNLVLNSKSWIEKLEAEEREKTGIASLKIRFNKVFGFYIEISRPNLSLVPDYFLRKQTLVNGERFITPELKKHEEIILTAEEKINTLEYQLYMDVLKNVLTFTLEMQGAAESIAAIDCLSTFAHISEKENYVRPKLLYSGEIRIKGGRHPVVEKLLDSDQQFVPNDVCLDDVKQQLLLITGPNMAGKSVFIRQVAVIVLLSQIGCFVPAEKAHLSIVDRIFVRSGASDVITAGLSTFMVEMVETAYILHHATRHSLIVMDEIGRGTSTYDGISIAWAVAEYLVTAFSPSPKTLFATHYHELQALEKEYPHAIKNYHMSVADDQGEPIFLHTLMPGGASHSFGVAVAKLAGVPGKVIEKAKEILENLESRNIEDNDRFVTPKGVGNDSIVDRLLHKELERIDIGNMTPLEALNKLAELKEKIKLLSSNRGEFLEVD